MSAKVRIACIGNMNNNFSVLVRFLRERGHDAELLLFPHELEHFRPMNDSYVTSFGEWTKTISWGVPFEFLRTRPETVRSDLKEYDFLIGCGSAPAFMHRAGVRLDLFVPYGTDILVYPFYKLTRNPLNLAPYNLFVRHQRKGIRSAGACLLDVTNEWFEGKFRRIGFRGERIRSFIPLVYLPEFHPDRIHELSGFSKIFPKVAELRQQNDLLLLHPVRHTWKNPRGGFAFKGNDRLFRGFATFVREHPDIRATIITCEYGEEVNESKELIADLGIGENVVWLPLTPRRDLLVAMNLVDMVVGELQRSFFAYGVVMEALSQRKPIMHNRQDHLYEPYYSDMYPMVHANSPDEVSEQLSRYIADRAFYQDIGRRGFDWFVKNMVDKPLGEIERIIREAAL